MWHVYRRLTLVAALLCATCGFERNVHGEDAADLYIEAIEYLNRKLPIEAVIDLHAKMGTPYVEPSASIRSHLADVRRSVGLAWRASHIDTCRWPQRVSVYGPGHTTGRRAQDDCLSLFFTLEADALNSIWRGNSESVVKNVAAMWALSSRLATEAYSGSSGLPPRYKMMLEQLADAMCDAGTLDKPSAQLLMSFFEQRQPGDPMLLLTSVGEDLAWRAEAMAVELKNATEVEAAELLLGQAARKISASEQRDAMRLIRATDRKYRAVWGKHRDGVDDPDSSALHAELLNVLNAALEQARTLAPMYAWALGEYVGAIRSNDGYLELARRFTDMCQDVLDDEPTECGNGHIVQVKRMQIIDREIPWKDIETLDLTEVNNEQIDAASIEGWPIIAWLREGGDLSPLHMYRLMDISGELQLAPGYLRPLITIFRLELLHSDRARKGGDAAMSARHFENAVVLVRALIEQRLLATWLAAQRLIIELESHLYQDERLDENLRLVAARGFAELSEDDPLDSNRVRQRARRAVTQAFEWPYSRLERELRRERELNRELGIEPVDHRSVFEASLERIDQWGDANILAIAAVVSIDAEIALHEQTDVESYADRWGLLRRASNTATRQPGLPGRLSESMFSRELCQLLREACTASREDMNRVDVAHLTPLPDDLVHMLVQEEQAIDALRRMLKARLCAR